MTKTYDVTCPDSYCNEDFEVELDPVTETDCIECPECLEEFDWEYDTETDTIALVSNEEEENDNSLSDDDDDEEDELG
jgi:hypothetical protein